MAYQKRDLQESLENVFTAARVLAEHRDDPNLSWQIQRLIRNLNDELLEYEKGLAYLAKKAEQRRKHRENKP